MMSDEEKEQAREEKAKGKPGPGKEISAAARKQGVKRDNSRR